jgi:hypothetical protein
MLLLVLGHESVLTSDYTRVDLMQLVEDAVDGCWIGYQARSAITGGDNGIGSVYSPPKDDRGSPVAATRKRHVETVVDIGFRPQVCILHHNLLKKSSFPA